jgi:hypothetical protein
MKKAFPGDPEYSWDRFYQLPYEYVLRGYHKMLDLRRTELHELELPVALNTAVYANSQRDPKSSKKPASPLDFAMFKPLEGQGPAGYYAACYVHMIKAKELPGWALFCYKDVAPSARGRVGGQYALFAHDAILVGPRKTEAGYKGFLIALESASGEVRTFSDPAGNFYDLTLPEIPTKVIAEEDVTLS